MKAVWTSAPKRTLLAFVSLLLAGTVRAQQTPVDTARAASLYPFSPAIEAAFQDGLAAWEEARYDDAYQSFRSVIEGPENRRTTAAMLMGGRALLASGRYAESVGLLTALIRRYPESRYNASALKLRDAAQERFNLRAEAQRETFEIGVLLPMTSGALRFSRSAFEGIRIAIDEFNGRGGRKARIVFEDSGGEPRRARSAAQKILDRADPVVLLGPLFSEEANAVARVAEEAGVPLLVPLATDDAVAKGRSMVFQANPTYEMRGRLMARRVIRRLRYTRLGVIADKTSFAGRMADGFISEAGDLGASIRFVSRLNGLKDWYTLEDRLGVDTLSTIDGLYMPITGDDARGVINIALTGLARRSPSIPLFGNGEWADYPDQPRMVQHKVVYAVDFHVDSTRAEVVQFDQEYRRRMGQEPDKPAFVGYDVTRFLLQHAVEYDATVSLPDVFHSGVVYRGLGINLYFGNGQVNQSLFFLAYGENGVTMLE